MGRRKGELSRFEIDRRWPHQVALPGEYVVAHFHAIMAAAQELGAAPRGYSVVHGGISYSVYCFADSRAAGSFLQRFDGVPFDPGDHGKGARWWQWNRPE